MRLSLSLCEPCADTYCDGLSTPFLACRGKKCVTDLLTGRLTDFVFTHLGTSDEVRTSLKSFVIENVARGDTGAKIIVQIFQNHRPCVTLEVHVQAGGIRENRLVGVDCTGKFVRSCQIGR